MFWHGEKLEETIRSRSLTSFGSPFFYQANELKLDMKSEFGSLRYEGGGASEMRRGFRTPFNAAKSISRLNYFKFGYDVRRV